MLETIALIVLGGTFFVFGFWLGRRLTLNEWRMGALVETCEWSEIEDGSSVYNTCEPGEEFHLTEGLGLWPHCHLCGKRIEVVLSEDK